MTDSAEMSGKNTIGDGRVEPILPAGDLDEIRLFYESLGFRSWFRGGGVNPDYEIVSRGNLVIHFFAHAGLKVADNDAGCYWRVRDADSLYHEFAALGLAVEWHPATDRSEGLSVGHAGIRDGGPIRQPRARGSRRRGDALVTALETLPVRHQKRFRDILERRVILP